VGEDAANHEDTTTDLWQKGQAAAHWENKLSSLPHLKFYLLRIFIREKNKIMPERGMTSIDIEAQARLSLLPWENNKHKN